MNIKKIPSLIKRYFLEVLLVLFVIIMATILRVSKIETTPGYEWDEPVYAQIASYYNKFGFPTIKQEGNEALVPYLYHPSFDFYLRSSWYKVTNTNGIASARILSVIGSVLLLLTSYFLFREFENKKIALISLILLSTDGWLIYTNRLNLMENLMMPLGVFAIAVYMFALRHHKNKYYISAGFLLAATAIYKHTGIFFLLIPAINWFLVRKDNKQHITLGVVAFLTIVSYVLGMYIKWGNIYFEQSFVQVKRTLGIFDSRGLNYTIQDGVKALINTYWIFITTIVSLIWGVIHIVLDTLNYFRKKIIPSNPLLFSWSLASLLFLGGISLKAPQYLVLALIPFYIYLTAIYIPKITTRRHHILLYTVLSLILIINGFTWKYRFFDRNDNALKSTFEYAQSDLPSDAVVLTEESIGTSIEQTYYKLDNYNSYERINVIKPDYIIIYTSTTQKPPESNDLKEYISASSIVWKTEGFKERITVYKTPSI